MKEILLAGGAIFSMFFGAGNIVFPPVLGETWPNSWPSAILGFFLTGVIVPLLGLISVVLFSGNTDKFFSPLGKVCGFLLQASIMAIEGPFGIVPRCFRVAYGGCKSLFPSVSALVFCGAVSICVGFMTIKRERVVPWVGKFLTPVKLGFLSLLIFWGLSQAITQESLPLVWSSPAFYDGILAGYQTYDLPGALYFSSMAMGYLISTKKNISQKSLFIRGITASCISAILLVIMYIGFICLGVQYSSSFPGVAPEDLLPCIVKESLGQFSNGIYSITIMVACMTTSVAAISVWTKFVTELLQPFKISYEMVLIASLGMAFAVSTLGFSGIVHFMQPILQYMYPILIAVTLFNLWKTVHRLSQKNNKNTC
ncbi:MAG: branched-chain amino acid transport system II carrier protein [Holosporales bacterium]|jgi:LIVCS family branched-chain amino acid:cation transporter|nr:branched-chain amino acid transport system II carrier protein [Holosporales bacterium]